MKSYKKRIVFHYAVIYCLICNTVNQANWNWTANLGLTVQVCESWFLHSLSDLQPLLSLSCVSACRRILTLRMLSQESFWPQAESERSWNVDRTDLPRQHEEWAGVIEGDEASWEVILPQNKRWKRDGENGSWDVDGQSWKRALISDSIVVSAVWLLHVDTKKAIVVEAAQFN